MIYIKNNTKFYDVIFYNKGGERHRLNGPAVIHGNYQKWYMNGELHREDGPAIIEGDYQVWYKNDIRIK